MWWGIRFVRQEDDAGFSWGDLTKRVHKDDLGVNRRIIRVLKYIFTNWDEEAYGMG
jgi:hypothetical protein